MDLESVYLRLPVFAQNLLCTLEGWRVRRFRFGSGYRELAAQVLERSQWPTERIRDFQNARLQFLMAHAYENVPYYRRLLKNLGAHPSDFHSVEDLRHLPVLTKTIVRENYDDLRAMNLREPVQKAHTSGTTGAGLQFWISQSAVREQWAVWWRYRQWHGITPETWCCYFGGRSIVSRAQQQPPFWRLNPFARQILYSAYHLKPANLGAYVLDLRRRGLPWIHGYPSLISLLAAAAEDSPGATLRFRFATTGAENLMPWQKKAIEKGLRCQVRQHYGCAEGAANLSECEEGRLHVDEDFSVVELQPIPGTSVHRMLGTSLANFAMPFIRYDIGDVCGPPQPCGCGRWGCAVERVDGRAEDYLVLSDGAYVGRVDHLFKDMTNIQEAQIWQRRPGEFEVRIVRAPRWSEVDEKRLLSEIRKRLGGKEEVRIRYVSELPRTQTGKLRLVVSEIDECHIEPLMENR